MDGGDRRDVVALRPRPRPVPDDVGRGDMHDIGAEGGYVLPDGAGQAHAHAIFAAPRPRKCWNADALAHRPERGALHGGRLDAPRHTSVHPNTDKTIERPL